MKKTVCFFLGLIMVLSVFVIAPLSVNAATVVTMVEATVPTPVVGATISQTAQCTSPTQGVTLTKLNWTTENGAIYSNDTKFQAGVTYYCDMEFWVEDGYTFPDHYTKLAGYINGKVGEISTVYYTDHAYVVVAFTPTKAGDVYVGGVGMTDGDYLPQDSETVTKTKPASDCYAYYKNGVLTLHDYSYTGVGFVLSRDRFDYAGMVYSNQSITVMLEGGTTLKGTCASLKTVGIWLEGDGAAVNGTKDSALSVDVSCVGIYSYNSFNMTNCTAYIFGGVYGMQQSNGDCNIQGSQVVISAKEIGILTADSIIVTNSALTVVSVNGHGLYCSEDITLTESTVSLTADTCAAYALVGRIVVRDCDLSFIGEYGLVNDLYDITIADSTINGIAYTCGIYAVDGNIAIDNTELHVRAISEDPEDDCYVFYVDNGSIYFGNGLIVYAATTLDGEFVPYQAEDNDSYRRVLITKGGHYLWGDVDMDGKITAADALDVLKNVVGKVSFTDQQKDLADTDRNAKVDAADALEILKHVVGKPSAIG
ncbi:MAG: hypothetical protein IKT68_01025 [Clostridia bacterium]|nr:hypothetical protein [Clostridia bacterium]